MLKLQLATALKDCSCYISLPLLGRPWISGPLFVFPSSSSNPISIHKEHSSNHFPHHHLYKSKSSTWTLSPRRLSSPPPVVPQPARRTTTSTRVSCLLPPHTQSPPKKEESTTDNNPPAFAMGAKKSGHEVDKNTAEKITDAGRGAFEKLTGKKVDPKISN